MNNGWQLFQFAVALVVLALASIGFLAVVWFGWRPDAVFVAGIAFFSLIWGSLALTIIYARIIAPRGV